MELLRKPPNTSTSIKQSYQVIAPSLNHRLLLSYRQWTLTKNTKHPNRSSNRIKQSHQAIVSSNHIKQSYQVSTVDYSHIEHEYLTKDTKHHYIDQAIVSSNGIMVQSSRGVRGVRNQMMMLLWVSATLDCDPFCRDWAALMVRDSPSATTTTIISKIN